MPPVSAGGTHAPDFFLKNQEARARISRFRTREMRPSTCFQHALFINNYPVKPFFELFNKMRFENTTDCYLM